MKKITLSLLLLGILSSYSIAHESHEKNPKESTNEKKVKKKEKLKEVHHSGGTNSYGCHKTSWGGYHCH